MVRSIHNKEEAAKVRIPQPSERGGQRVPLSMRSFDSKYRICTTIGIHVVRTQVVDPQYKCCPSGPANQPHTPTISGTSLHLYKVETCTSQKDDTRARQQVTSAGTGEDDWGSGLPSRLNLCPQSPAYHYY